MKVNSIPGCYPHLVALKDLPGEYKEKLTLHYGIPSGEKKEIGTTGKRPIRTYHPDLSTGTAEIVYGTSDGLLRPTRQLPTTNRSQHPRFDGTPYGQFLDSLRSGDTEGLFESISQIEKVAIQLSRIFQIRLSRCNGFLSGMQEFAKRYGLVLSEKQIRVYCRTVPRRSLTSECSCHS